MGLGCGNPVTLADLREGETVVDLGSGGGIDVFLAARQVGPSGRGIGGGLSVSDMVARGELPEEIRETPELWASCIGGALPDEEYLETIRQAGFPTVEGLPPEGLGRGPGHSITA